VGHSDGDVLAHAVIDALLGAAALGDIGEMFPPGDPAWKDACSMELLRLAWEKVKAAGWGLVNLDCVIICERPRILPFRDRIREALAAALGVEREAVFIKGKTSEALGIIGEGLAAEAEALCLLERQDRGP
jgi:2-C-methyl-D-erythritol 2,4-cyclodiphosphate synthase